MKAALISLGSTSSQWTADAMKKYFDEVDMIQLKHVEVSLGKEANILYQGNPFKEYDCVYIKGSFRYANLLRSIASMLETKNIYLPLPSKSFSLAHNKLLTHLILQQHNIPMPKTYISSTVEAAKELLNKVNFPIVMKFPEGTQGKGVMFADSISSAASMLDALEALNQPFLIQEYVETGGTDVRALVVGGKVIAGMKRRAKDGDKRSNTHSGGTPEQVLISHEMSKIAVKTANAIGADICGVDILETALGPLVIEVNISPGLQGISSVSNIDIPNEIAQFLARRTQETVYSKKKEQAKKVMKEIAMNLGTENGIEQEIVTSLTFRAQRVLLPPFVTKIAKMNEDKEYIIKASKGKVVIKESDM